MHYLRTKAMVAILVFLAGTAFGGGLIDDILAAGALYQRDSQTNESAAHDNLLRELNRIKAKATANHESDIVSFVDDQIKGLEEQKTPAIKQIQEWSNLQYRPAPYAKPVPNKPGFVFSPFVNDKDKGYIDVRGFPRGTEIKDPYTGKLFLVP